LGSFFSLFFPEEERLKTKNKTKKSEYIIKCC
jgi:hypothetical protein